MATTALEWAVQLKAALPGLCAARNLVFGNQSKEEARLGEPTWRIRVLVPNSCLPEGEHRT
jgi:hypothetical protein